MEDEATPAWAHEPIVIHDADRKWLERGATLASQLSQRLDPWLTAGVHHVGSTAVAGLAAKPVLDLMAGVARLEAADPVTDELKEDGWHLVPPSLDGREWRRFLVWAPGERRLAHLHLMSPDHPRWSAQLVFRDLLRADAALRRDYEALKRQLAERFVDDREAFSRAKTDFIAEVLELADVWP